MGLQRDDVYGENTDPFTSLVYEKVKITYPRKPKCMELKAQ